MRPTYGCYLRRLLFAPNDDTTAGLAIHYVRSAIERWEPRIDILALDATRHPERPDLAAGGARVPRAGHAHTNEVVVSYSLDGEAVPA